MLSIHSARSAYAHAPHAFGWGHLAIAASVVGPEAAGAQGLRSPPALIGLAVGVELMRGSAWSFDEVIPELGRSEPVDIPASKGVGAHLSYAFPLPRSLHRRVGELLWVGALGIQHLRGRNRGARADARRSRSAVCPGEPRTPALVGGHALHLCRPRRRCGTVPVQAAGGPARDAGDMARRGRSAECRAPGGSVYRTARLDAAQLRLSAGVCWHFRQRR